jgi:hypothetical protein
MLYRTLNFLQTILPYWFAFFIIMVAYGWMSNEDFKNSSNQDTVTFKVSCNTVLADPMRYPEYVYEHCRKITSKR